MVEKVYQFIKQNNMLKKCHTIVTGVSGGADSVCLLRILCEIRTKYNLPVQIVAVHVNHGIRGAEAARDASFVQKLCMHLEVPCREVCVDVPILAKQEHLSEEEAGRLARYEAFEQIAAQYGNAQEVCIAVAHHREDQAETVLMNLFRGSSMKGAAGMQPVREQIIRPLLTVSRKEIEQYLAQIDQNYITDSTNLTDIYLRNRLRNQILPEITELVNEHAISHICAFAQTASDAERFLDKLTQRVYAQCVETQEDVMRIAIERLIQEDIFLQERVIYQVLIDYAGKKKDIYRVHIEAIAALLSQQVGCRVDLPYGIVVIRTYTHLEFRHRLVKKDIQEQTPPLASIDIQRLRSLQIGQIYDVVLRKNVYIENKLKKIDKISFQRVQMLEKDVENRYTIYFNPYFLQSDIIIRSRQVQDHFFVKGQYGQQNTKKLKKELIDQKVPAQYRDDVLLFAQDKQIFWIVGIRKCVDLPTIQYSGSLIRATVTFM